MKLEERGDMPERRGERLRAARSGTTTVDETDASPLVPGSSGADLLRGRRRLVGVLALTALLVVQAAYSFLVVPEPYPAVRMPSFAGAPSKAGLFDTETLTISVDYADGSQGTPSVEAFMSPIRDSAALDSAAHVLSPGVNRVPNPPIDDPAVRAFVAARAAAVGDGRRPVFVEFCWRADHVDARTGTYVDRPACDTLRVAV